MGEALVTSSPEELNRAINVDALEDSRHRLAIAREKLGNCATKGLRGWLDKPRREWLTHLVASHESDIVWYQNELGLIAEAPVEV